MIAPSKYAWGIALGASILFHGIVFLGLGEAEPSPQSAGSTGALAQVWGIPGSQFDVEGEVAPVLTEAEPIPQDAPLLPDEASAKEPLEVAETEIVQRLEIQPAIAVTNGNVALLPDVPVTEQAPAEVTEIEAEFSPPMPELSPRPPERPRRTTRPTPNQNTRTNTPSNTPPAAAPRRQRAGTGQAAGNAQAQTATPGRAELRNYSGRVASHLRRRQRYPRAAARRRLAGSVGVRFTINKSGSVTAVRITNLSGDILFREEVLSMVRRANPFPAIPDDFKRSSMSFNQTIRFAPR